MIIEDIFIDDIVLDGNVKEKIVNKTSNSIEVTRTKRTSEGVDCTQWFTWNDFQKKFKHLTWIE